MSKMVFIGVDGCKGGWFAVFLAADSTNSKEWEIGIFNTFSCLINSIKENYGPVDFLVLVDIPIGLKEGSKGTRLSDLEARKLLKTRKSSIFPVPCREAVYAENYSKACEINEKLTGKKISKQTWNILPKIRDVDNFLIENEIFRQKIREVSPELCFQVMSNLPIKYSKKTLEGFLERKEVLRPFFPIVDELVETALLKYKRQELVKDDILDVLATAITAKLGYNYGFEYTPQEPEIDNKGLQIQLVYFIPDNL